MSMNYWIEVPDVDNKTQLINLELVSRIHIQDEYIWFTFANKICITPYNDTLLKLISNICKPSLFPRS